MDVDRAALLRLMERELDLDPGELTESSRMTEVELWDSLAHLRLCLALEAEYGVSIPMEEVGEVTTVPAIIDFLSHADG